MTEDDVGAYYIDENRDVWRMISYCAYPTASLQKVNDPDQRRGGAVGSPILNEFTRLVPVTEKS